MHTRNTLADLHPGETAVVRDLTTSGAMRRRMQDIGLTPGTRVECVFRSPLGDPKAYSVRGAIFALRCEDSAGILIHGQVDL